MKTNVNASRKPAWKKWVLTTILAASVLPVLPVRPVSASDNSDKMDAVLQVLSQVHVSGTGENKLSDSAIRGMVESLKDPYTQYMSKEEWGQFQSSLSRNYVGIGAELGRDDKGVYIGNVFNGSPAAEGGLLEGDYIVGVNGKSTEGMGTSEVTGLVRGDENTAVEITVKRNGQDLTVKLTRRAIQLPVLESHVFDGGVGYVKLYSFSNDSDEKFNEALDKLQANKDFKALVLDLRDNPGGLLQSAANIAARFIENGTMIHTKDRNGKDTPVVISGGSRVNVPVYILVDENSASCSEVLTGALQDYKLAVVAGTRTYGKGSVQQVYQFQDGSSLKVTIEEYLTPNGNKVNGVGITPDQQLDGSLNQLLTVLREAGVNQLTVSKNRSSLEVNGFKTDAALPAYEENGHTWIHSRVLADLIGADTTWVPESNGVQVKLGDQSVLFSEGQGNAKFIENLMLIDLQAFQQAFPSLTVTGDLNHLEMASGKE